MIKSQRIKEEMPEEIESNWTVLQNYIESKLKEIGIEGNTLGLNELAKRPKVVQILFSDPELFEEFMDTIGDVINMNKKFETFSNSIKETVQGLTQESDMRKGANQIKEEIFKIFDNEIDDFGEDDEIKRSFDQGRQKSEKLMAKYRTESENKENRHQFKQNGKSIKTEERVEKIKREREEEAKKEKQKVLQQTRDVNRNVDFERVQMVEAEIIMGKERLINDDCPPRIRIEMEKERDEGTEKLKNESGLEILGNNKELWDVYEGWLSKPMLRVMTNRFKQKIQNNIGQMRDQGKEGVSMDGEIKRFIETKTNDVEDTVDLFGEEDYLNDLYMSGSRFYRHVERRVLFPYSDSLERFKKSHMLSDSSMFVDEIRTNIFCYEREALKNYRIREFYRISDDEISSMNKVLVLYIFKISELSQNKNFEMTATFFALNKKNIPIQGTVTFSKIKDFFVFEGQYVCVSGSFTKGILEVDSVLPFDSANVINNEWNVKEVENLSGGEVKIKEDLEKEVKGEIEGQEQWTRALRITKETKTSMGDRIVEEVGKGGNIN
jgi:hypothetical protein